MGQFFLGHPNADPSLYQAQNNAFYGLAGDAQRNTVIKAKGQVRNEGQKGS